MKTRNLYQPAITLYFIIQLLFSSVLFAQKPNYKFKSILESDGLINSTVQTIYEDSYGFIWLGTHHGVQRFDGKTFTDFEKANDSIGLSHNYINNFCEDKNGNIWISTSLGLNTYIRETDKILRYRWQGELDAKFYDLNIIKALQDEFDDNLIWISAVGEGIIRLNITSNETIIFPVQNAPESWIQGLLQHPAEKGKLILGSSGILIFDKKTGDHNSIFNLQQSSEVIQNRINDIVVDPRDNNILWLATGDIWGRGTLGGLIKFSIDSGKAQHFTIDNRKDEIPDKHILQVCFYNENKLWLGTRNNGALLYDLADDKFYNYQYNEYDDGSFVTENAIRSMLLDHSGTMWFGTWGDGMSILSPALQKFTHYKHLPGIQNGLPDNYITGITEDFEGHIWIGTKSGGLSKFNPIDKTFENHFPEFKESNPPTEITFVHCDSRNNIWIGTYANALYRYNYQTGRKIHYPKGSSPKNVSQRRISAIAELTPGEILISTYGGGLNIYNYEMDAIQKFMNNPDDPTSIPDNQIWLPFLGDDGNYYFGGNSIVGLIQFDPVTHKFTQPTIDQQFTTYIDAAKSTDGHIYVDAISVGLAQIIIGDTVEIKSLNNSDGKNIRNVESIAIDKNNLLWMGTGNGLVKYNPIRRIFTRYDIDDGLQDYHFYRFAGFAASTGEMYFGGKNGFNVFQPNDIKLSDYKPPIVFTEFKLFQEKVEIGDKSPLTQSLLLAESITLNHNQNDFSISFSALDFSNPHKIKYKYKLINQDEDWLIVDYTGIASYTNMYPGSYTFQVASTNADGVWNDQLSSLDIVIYPPWWQTTLAYVIYGLIFIIAFFVVDRIQRKRFKEKQKSKAREKELVHAKQIEKAYNKLKTTQSQLIHSEKMASLGELTAGIAHEIQNPLNFVNNFSDVSIDLLEELNEELSEGNKEEVKSISQDLKQNLDKIHHHGERASSIVRGMLEHSRAGNDKKQPTDINAMADEYIRLAYHGIRAKDNSFNADFKADLDETLPKINVVGQDIARVVLNLINNAFHACAERSRSAVSAKTSANADPNYKPFVSISTKKINGQVEISVKDNGMGIPENILDKIFQPFFTTKASGEGTGLGLSLSYDIITKGHDGELKVETKEGEGSEFIILLPV